jgi:hypothetical protein
MSGPDVEREEANRLPLDELRKQRAEIQERISAAQETLRTTLEAITKSQRLLAQIDGQLQRANELAGKKSAVKNSQVVDRASISPISK